MVKIICAQTGRESQIENEKIKEYCEKLKLNRLVAFCGTDGKHLDSDESIQSVKNIIYILPISAGSPADIIPAKIIPSTQQESERLASFREFFNQKLVVQLQELKRDCEQKTKRTQMNLNYAKKLINDQLKERTISGNKYVKSFSANQLREIEELMKERMNKIEDEISSQIKTGQDLSLIVELLTNLRSPVQKKELCDFIGCLQRYKILQTTITKSNLQIDIYMNAVQRQHSAYEQFEAEITRRTSFNASIEQALAAIHQVCKEESERRFVFNKKNENYILLKEQRSQLKMFMPDFMDVDPNVAKQPLINKMKKFVFESDTLNLQNDQIVQFQQLFNSIELDGAVQAKLSEIKDTNMYLSEGVKLVGERFESVVQYSMALKQQLIDSEGMQQTFEKVERLNIQKEGASIALNEILVFVREGERWICIRSPDSKLSAKNLLDLKTSDLENAMVLVGKLVRVEEGKSLKIEILKVII